MLMRLAAMLLGLAMLGAAAGTAAAPPPSLYLEDLTWTELRDAVAHGHTTIILPVGGTEQSGPDMALGKHNVRARALAGRIAAELGNALVAPVLAYVPEGNYDPPTQHMRFPGTISVPADAFRKILEGAARSFRLAGFRDIVLIGDHGGYQKDLEAVAERLDREWQKTPVRVRAVTAYYRASETTYVEALKAQGFTAQEIGTHAGVADTSLMLAVDPHLVRLERLRTDTAGAAAGVYGDPRRSSAEAGKAGVDAMVAAAVAAIRKDTAR
jgi:creatinine amidohydrolase/Fe(II)-dependent formamide hydrolase-like protein